MPHWTEQQSGGGAASQYFLQAQGSSILAVPANGRRISVTMYNGGGGVMALGYGATAQIATHMPISSGMLLYEQDYKGAINAVASGGGSAALFITDVMVTP
jgi:hypothetical protein